MLPMARYSKAFGWHPCHPQLLPNTHSSYWVSSSLSTFKVAKPTPHGGMRLSASLLAHLPSPWLATSHRPSLHLPCHSHPVSATAFEPWSLETSHWTRTLSILLAGHFVFLFQRPAQSRRSKTSCWMSATNSFETLSFPDIKVRANWILFSSKDFTAAECFHTFV